MNLGTNEEFFKAMNEMIYRWCDQRALWKLAILLPAATSMTPHTDSWEELRETLRNLRSRGYERIGDLDWSIINELIRELERRLDLVYSVPSATDESE